MYQNRKTVWEATLFYFKLIVMLFSNIAVPNPRPMDWYRSVSRLVPGPES